MHWIANAFWWVTGARDEGGRAYGFWSGFGGAVPDFLILGSLAVVYRKHVCAHKPCRRIARHTTKDGYKLCQVHVGKPLAALDLPPVHSDHR
jgi:hypothetical protein